jgi:MinD superfamily P-loop ATPase
MESHGVSLHLGTGAEAFEDTAGRVAVTLGNGEALTADLVVLVVEPTPFGFHDMRQTEQILQQMEKNYIIIANKAMNNSAIETYFHDRTKQVALTIPLDERYHKANLRGEILSQQFEEIHSGLYRVISEVMPS